MADAITEALDRLDAGDWEGAHDLVQHAEGPQAAWLHAHLHRLEGDPANAAYWYQRAGREPFDGTPEDERTALRAAQG